MDRIIYVLFLAICIASTFAWKPETNNDNRPVFKSVEDQGTRSHNSGNLLKSVCDTDWITSGQNCYLVVDMYQTWNKAKVFCNSMNSELTDIRSSAEHEFLKNYLKQNGGSGEYFIGTRYYSEGIWYWPDIVRILFFDWAEGQPNGGEDCICLSSVSGFMWHDYGCLSEQKFICKK